MLIEIRQPTLAHCRCCKIEIPPGIDNIEAAGLAETDLLLDSKFLIWFRSDAVLSLFFNGDACGLL